MLVIFIPAFLNNVLKIPTINVLSNNPFFEGYLKPNLLKNQNVYSNFFFYVFS